MSFLKITPELLAALGAKDESECAVKLIEVLGTIKGKADAGLTETVTALSGKFTTLEARVSAIPAPIGEDRIKAIAVASVPADIKTLAINAGKEAAVSAIAGTGSGQPVKASPQGNDEGGKKSPADSLNASGKFEEAWAADENIKAEFPTATSYAAYMRNMDRVRFHNQRTAAK